MQNRIGNDGAEVSDNHKRRNAGENERQRELAFPAGPKKEESAGHPQHEFRQSCERIELQSVQPESPKNIRVHDRELVRVEQHIRDRKSKRWQPGRGGDEEQLWLRAANKEQQ